MFVELSSRSHHHPRNVSGNGLCMRIVPLVDFCMTHVEGVFLCVLGMWVYFFPVLGFGMDRHTNRDNMRISFSPHPHASATALYSPHHAVGPPRFC